VKIASAPIAASSRERKRRSNPPSFVMAGLDPAIHDLLSDRMKTWMPAPSAGMT
jgi:hypothetical protein